MDQIAAIKAAFSGAPMPRVHQIAETYIQTIAPMVAGGATFDLDACAAHGQAIHKAALIAEITAGLDAPWTPGIAQAPRRLLKDVGANRRDFILLLAQLLQNAQKVGRDGFRRQLFTLVRGYSRELYRDGLRDGGVTPPDQLTVDDAATLERHIKAQTRYVRALVDVMFGDSPPPDDTLGNRPLLWYNKSIYPAYLLGLQSAARNGMFVWRMNFAKENCRTCRALNGQVHRMKDYVSSGFVPHASKLECGGWQCGCVLVPAPGQRARGKFPHHLTRKSASVDKDERYGLVEVQHHITPAGGSHYG